MAISSLLNAVNPAQDTREVFKTGAKLIAGYAAIDQLRNCLPVDATVRSFVPAFILEFHDSLQKCGPYNALGSIAFTAGMGALAVGGAYVVAKKGAVVLGAIHNRLPNKPAWVVKVQNAIAYPEFAKVKHDSRAAKFLPAAMVAAKPGTHIEYKWAKGFWFIPNALTGGFLFSDRVVVEDKKKP